jgi:hypothetical protein
MLVEVAPLSEPQAGEQALPPVTNAQVTPELVESFLTLAFKVTAAAPAAMEVILLAIVTEMGCGPPPPPELELEQPGRPARETMISRKQEKEDTLAKVRAHIRMAYPIAEVLSILNECNQGIRQLAAELPRGWGPIQMNCATSTQAAILETVNLDRL